VSDSWLIIYKRISGYLPLQTQFEITILCRAHRVFLFIFCLYYVSVEYCTNTAFIYVTAYTPKNKRLEKQTCKVHTLSWSSKIAQKWSAELVWHRPTYRLDITAVVGKMRYCGIWNAEGKCGVIQWLTGSQLLIIIIQDCGLCRAL